MSNPYTDAIAEIDAQLQQERHQLDGATELGQEHIAYYLAVDIERLENLKRIAHRESAALDLLRRLKREALAERYMRAVHAGDQEKATELKQALDRLERGQA